MSNECTCTTCAEALPPEFLVEDDDGNLHAPPPPDGYIRPPT